MVSVEACTCLHTLHSPASLCELGLEPRPLCMGGSLHPHRALFLCSLVGLCWRPLFLPQVSWLWKWNRYITTPCPFAVRALNIIDVRWASSNGGMKEYYRQGDTVSGRTSAQMNACHRILSPSQGPQPLGPSSVVWQIKGSFEIKMGVWRQ